MRPVFLRGHVSDWGEWTKGWWSCGGDSVLGAGTQLWPTGVGKTRILTKFPEGMVCLWAAGCKISRMNVLSREGVGWEWSGQEFPELIPREPAGSWKWSERGTLENLGGKLWYEANCWGPFIPCSMFRIWIFLKANGNFWKIFMIKVGLAFLKDDSRSRKKGMN